MFNANTWTNDNTNEPKAKERAWDYAGSLGGPIFKNKTFFYGTFERYTQVDWRIADYSASVPTSDFMGGNFAALLGPRICIQSDNESCARLGAGTTPISVMNKAGQTFFCRRA